MVLNRSYTIEKDNMPQTVPSAGYTPPCDYSAFAADSFDLSLLPPSPPGGQNDADFPLSPSTLLYTSSPPSMFGASFDTKNIKPPQIYTSFYPNSPPLDSKEHIFDDIATKNIYSSFQQQQSPLLTVLKEEPNTNQYLTPSFPLSAPISPPSSCTSYSNHSSPIYPQSVSPAHQIKHENTLDLQESLEDFRFVQKSFEAEKFGTNTTYQDPFSPQGNFSPHTAHSPFRDNFNGQLSPESLTSRQVPENIYQSFIGIDTKDVKKNSDHQLLREVLRDTSFQKKYNLRPFDFGGLVTGFVDSIKMEEPDNSVQRRAENGSNGTGDGDGARQGEDLLMSSCHEELTRERIEPVLSLAIEQMRKDVDNTCSALGISPDPTRWTKEDVKAWLLWTLQQFTLAPIQMDYFNMDGQMMASLTEEEFTQRTPQNGSILHAQLEIWKAACADTDLGGMSSSSSTPLQQGSTTTTTAGPSGVLPGSSTTGATTSSVVSTQWTPTPSSTHSSTSSKGDISEDEEEDTASTIPSTVGPSTHSGVGKATPSRGASGGGSHIHLWQFLKELLASPTLYGSAIRWLDRGKGVFKIEDSVRVARLWGKRKNRPAMNYDKLSRSIRQYYKKGIMKKTERSQRLVYQFCHPYSL